MNKFFSVLVLGSALALSACGGDSDSSGSNNNTPDLPTNPTTPTTPTTPTKPTTPTTPTKPNPGTQNSCNVSGNTVTGTNNSSCIFKNSTSNAVISCSNAGLVVDGNIGGITLSKTTFVSKSTNLNGFDIKCQ